MKYISFFLISTNFLFAATQYELLLYEKILPSIFHNTPLKIYASQDEYKLLKYSNKFNLVSYCDSSVVLLLGSQFENLPKECQNKPIFATNYRVFKNNTHSFGAFYWRKGRPQIIFDQAILNNYNITLPDSLKKYLQ